MADAVIIKSKTKRRFSAIIEAVATKYRRMTLIPFLLMTVMMMVMMANTVTRTCMTTVAISHLSTSLLTSTTVTVVPFDNLVSCTSVAVA